MKINNFFLRIMVLALSLILALVAFSSCNNESTSSSEPESIPEQSVEESTEPEPLSLNIGSYNIAHGQFINYDMQPIADDILEKDLDIVGLQEVDINADRSQNIDSLALLSQMTGYKYYAYYKTVDLATEGQYGVAILSKYPIVETNRFDLPSPGVEARVLGYAKIDVEGTNVNFFVTHASFEKEEIRVSQFEYINTVLKDFDNFMIAGDFNTSNFEEYKKIENASTLNTAENNLPTHKKTESIDNIVYSTDDWGFETPQILEKDHSDHSMLYSKATMITKSEG